MTDILKYKGFEGSAELDMSSQVCWGKLLFIDDLVTYQAETPSSLQSEFEAAVDDYLETCAFVGKEPQRPCKGQFNVRVPHELHRAAQLRAVKDGISLNEVVVRSMDAYLNTSTVVNHNHLHLSVADYPLRTVPAIGSNEFIRKELDSVH